MRRLGVIGLLLITAACRTAPSTTRQLVLLAVDGFDPAILTRLIADGRLPHMAELARTSGVVRVTSTPGAESASAWASFATGVNPGMHGVFDAVTPDPASGRPAPATLRPRPSRRWAGGGPWREGAAYARVQDGAPFWSVLGRAGIRSRVLFVPGTFPPEPVPAGSIVSGTPLPDWGGSWGAGYTWLASDVRPDEVGFTRYGGRLVRLTFNRNLAHATIVGLRSPARIELPVTVAWSPEDRSANITIGDETVHLNEGQQSRWLTLSVRLSVVTRIQGLVRVHLVKAGNDVQVYVSPIQWHPGSPPSPIASPPRAAFTLFGRLGPFRTLVWPEAGWALADGRLSDEAFETAQVETFNDRAAALLNQADSRDWDLLVTGIETLEATGRRFWRGAGTGASAAEAASGVPQPRVVTAAYERLDGLVGELRARLPGTPVALVSAYGLSRSTRVVDLNRWLTEQGWLVWHQPAAPVTLAALADSGLWTDTVDWSRTAARAMGAGHIYVNLRGRWPGGLIEPGAEYEQLVAHVRKGLEALIDPLTRQHVVARVRTAREAYSGAHLLDAPDLVVTWAPGYAGTWDAMLGGAAAAVVDANQERWAAEHAGVDERSVPGAWISSLPLGAKAISVLDVAPTVMQYFGLASPAGEGQSQLRDMPSSTSRR